MVSLLALTLALQCDVTAPGAALVEGSKPDPAGAQITKDQTVPAVIDRIEDGIAVVLVGAEEHETTCSANSLPSGVRAGGAVRLRLDGDRVIRIEADPDEDAVRAARIGAKLEWLKDNRTAKGGQWPDVNPRRRGSQ